MLSSNEIWCLLTSHGKLDRDRGVEKLQQICDSYHSNTPERKEDTKQVSEAQCDEVLSDIFQKLVQYPMSRNETQWETKIGSNVQKDKGLVLIHHNYG